MTTPATRIYVYEADLHCAACFARRFAPTAAYPDVPPASFLDTLDWIIAQPDASLVDREGNPVTIRDPYESTDTTLCCGDCGTELLEVEDATVDEDPADDDDDEPTEPEGGDYILEEHPTRTLVHEVGSGHAAAFVTTSSGAAL